MTNLPAILISDIEIRQDAEGRFCLNDLHKASGGLKRHQPSNWLRQDYVQEIISELEDSNPHIRGVKPLVTNPGRYGGTFVVKELVYSYAMWVSPKFHLHVIRTFDAAQNNQVLQIQDPAMRLIVSMAVEFDALKREQQEQRETTQALIKRDKKRAREQAKLTYRLDSIETAQDYFTILGWWHLTFTTPLDNTKAAKYGKIATRYCREHGFEIGQVQDPRFGLVNTYPREVLELLLAD
jgi:hypothetical protein